MSEAKQRRGQHFQSQIFPQTGAGAPSQHRRSDTFTSTVFSGAAEAPSQPYSNPHASNYARQKYQAESSAFAGAVEQAADYRERQTSRMEPTEMKIAGKKPYPVQDYEYKPRHIRTQSSTVFAPAEDSSARYNPYKPQDAYDILGNEGNAYYRKTVNEEIPVGKFEPRYRQVQAHDMKHREFYGGDAPDAEEYQEEVQSRGSADRKLDYLSSSVFPTDNPRASTTPNRPTRLQSTRTPDPRSQKDQSFNIFGEVKQERATARPAPQPQLRSTHQLSSNLFDRNFEYSPAPARDKLSASTMDWRNVESEARRKDRDFTVEEMAQDQLRSQLYVSAPRMTAKENGDLGRPATSQVRTEGRYGAKNRDLASDMHPDNFYEQAYPDSTPTILDFDLNGLGAHMNAQELRKLCGNVHLVSASTDVDPVKDRCTGTGRVQVRVTRQTEPSLVTMKTNLAKEGISVTAHKENAGRKSNYSGTANVYWNDHRVEIEGRKKDEDLPPAKVAMMKNLESHGKAFNSAAGMWSEEWKQAATRQGKDTTREEREALSAWNQMRRG